jgi:hypothetical protein
MRWAGVLFLAVPAFCESRLPLNSGDVQRIQRLAKFETWAAQTIRQLTDAAGAWPESHIREFGLAEWALPKGGSGWSRLVTLVTRLRLSRARHAPHAKGRQKSLSRGREGLPRVPDR